MTREELKEFREHNTRLISLLQQEFSLLLEMEWWPTLKHQIEKLESILESRGPRRKSSRELLQTAARVLRECQPIICETPAIENSLPDRIDCACADIEEELE